MDGALQHRRPDNDIEGHQLGHKAERFARPFRLRRRGQFGKLGSSEVARAFPSRRRAQRTLGIVRQTDLSQLGLPNSWNASSPFSWS